MSFELPEPPFQLLPAFGYRRERWANGAGWTRHVASELGGDGRLSWRLSIAEIDADCSYSPFVGLQRHQVLLCGHGFSLDFGDGGGIDVGPPAGEAAFPGDAAVHCRLRDGPVQVLNLFHDRARWQATLWRRPLVGPMYVFPAEGEVWLLHVLAGQVQLAAEGAPGACLEREDSAIVGGPGAAAERVVIEGGGELLVMRLSPAVPAASGDPSGA